MTEAPAPASARSARSVWWSRRSVLAHVALVIWVPGCAVAAWWQVGIALGGDSLGWVYSVMWPCFAVFGIVFWWFLVHDDPEQLGARGLRRRQAQTAAAATDHDDDQTDKVATDEAIAAAEAEDPELAAYNAYLASAAQRPKTWRRR
ncbi:MAG TPA: hypothetical protein VE991_12255 [Acidimicrobiales bacterium]|nr:hypothetical protein [Acidimicrobiales bacterium]